MEIYNYPIEKSGLYLLAVKNGHWIKIGKSNNIKKRMKTYYTHNPNFIFIGCIEVDKNILSYKEKSLQFILEDKSKKRFQKEWYKMKKKMYKKITKKSFYYFKNLF